MTIKEIIEALGKCEMRECDSCSFKGQFDPGCVIVMHQKVAESLKTILTNQKEAEGPKPLSYWDLITAINERQETKGRAKYGEDLEDNTTLTTVQRIEHAEEEAIDLLKYLEHLKQVAVDGITANDYQRAALRTARDFCMHDLMMNGVLGLSGETGEVADHVKKAVFQGHDLDKDHLADELGDVAWYLAVTAHAIGYDLGDIFQGNVDKLKKRYPDGFDKSRSIHREEEQA